MVNMGIDAIKFYVCVFIITIIVFEKHLKNFILNIENRMFKQSILHTGVCPAPRPPESEALGPKGSSARGR